MKAHYNEVLKSMGKTEFMDLSEDLFDSSGSPALRRAMASDGERWLGPAAWPGGGRASANVFAVPGVVAGTLPNTKISI